MLFLLITLQKNLSGNNLPRKIERSFHSRNLILISWEKHTKNLLDHQKILTINEL